MSRSFCLLEEEDGNFHHVSVWKTDKKCGWRLLIPEGPGWDSWIRFLKRYPQEDKCWKAICVTSEEEEEEEDDTSEDTSDGTSEDTSDSDEHHPRPGETISESIRFYRVHVENPAGEWMGYFPLPCAYSKTNRRGRHVVYPPWTIPHWRGVLDQTSRALEPFVHQQVYQKWVLEDVKGDWQTPKETHWVFTLNWAMGSGKTLGVLRPLLCGTRPARKVVVVTAKSLVEQWKKVLRTCVPESNGGTHILIFNYFRFEQDIDELMDADVIIIDEIQHYKNLNPATHYMFYRLQQYDGHLFALTGTLMPNSPLDARGLLAFYGESIESLELPEEAKGFNATPVEEQTLITPQRLRDWCQGRLSYFDPKVHAKDDFTDHYPDVHEQTRFVDFELPFLVHYLHYGSQVDGRFKSLDSFIYQTSFYGEEEKVHPKFQMVVDHIRKHGRPYVVHSEYVERTLVELKDHLEQELQMSVEIVDGKTTALHRQNIFNLFNEDKLDVLLISRAAAAGVDLIGARGLLMMDVGDNLGSEAQIKGRVVRMHSHHHRQNKRVDITQCIGRFDPLIHESVKTWPSKLKKAVHRECQHVGWARKDAEASCRHVQSLFQKAPFRGKMVSEWRHEQNLQKYEYVRPFQKVLEACSIEMPNGRMKPVKQRRNRTSNPEQKLALEQKRNDHMNRQRWWKQYPWIPYDLLNAPEKTWKRLLSKKENKDVWLPWWQKHVTSLYQAPLSYARMQSLVLAFAHQRRKETWIQSIEHVSLFIATVLLPPVKWAQDTLYPFLVPLQDVQPLRKVVTHVHAWLFVKSYCPYCNRVRQWLQQRLKDDVMVRTILISELDTKTHFLLNPSWKKPISFHTPMEELDEVFHPLPPAPRTKPYMWCQGYKSGFVESDVCMKRLDALLRKKPKKPSTRKKKQD
jgi:superfamily II DNA or RNA helicase